MNSYINTLMSLSIMTALSDREVFIEKVSSYLETLDLNEQNSERLAKVLAEYLENIKNNINMHNVFKENNQQIEKDIVKLSEQLEIIAHELQLLKIKN